MALSEFLTMQQQVQPCHVESFTVAYATIQHGVGTFANPLNSLNDTHVLVDLVVVLKMQCYVVVSIHI